MKVLLVTLYFPPAGGGGVQRALKLAQYLPALGIETHVLAPDDPKWIHRDAELRVPTQAWVHRVAYLGPKARRPAEELHGTTGLDRAVAHARIATRRLLVPDASVTWNLTAIPAAIRIARREGIDAVITTSPPGSVHFVGAAVKRATGAAWLADVRDALVANPHRRADTTATKAKQAANVQLGRLVAGYADAISAVSDAIADELQELSPRGVVRTIANGSDFDDFAGLEYRRGERFRITHTGSFFGQRDPRPFLQALADSGLDAVARFVGDFRAADREWAEGLGLGDRLELIPYSPRAESLAPAARLGGAPAPRPRGGRPREGRAQREGVRVSRGRAPDPRRRAHRTAPRRGSSERRAPVSSSRPTTSTGSASALEGMHRRVPRRRAPRGRAGRRRQAPALARGTGRGDGGPASRNRPVAIGTILARA